MPEAAALVDEINKRAMGQSVLEYDAIVSEGLNSAERAALHWAIGDSRDCRILDLGVGAGRTVREMRAMGRDYVGVDYTPAMVAHCRDQHPGVRFEALDARALTAFEASSFDLVFFSCNGICMVDHAGRMRILSEVLRVLVPGGAFVFSTSNRNSDMFETAFIFPTFRRSGNPIRWIPRVGRFLAQTAVRATNRLRLKRHDIRTSEYALVNDVAHHYSTMIYYTDLAHQVRQLRTAGFAPDYGVFDLQGRVTDERCRDPTLTFATRKP